MLCPHPICLPLASLSKHAHRHVLTPISLPPPYARVSTQVQSSTGALLRERGSIANSTSMVDDILAQAATVSSNLMDQRRLFDSVGDKILQVGARFPVVNGLLNAIRRKKSKDTLVLAGVIAACTLFTLIYVFAR